MFFTYVLRSNKDGRLYIGLTSDLKVRVAMHNAGEIESTKNRRPFALVYYEACTSKQKAEKRERYFKTGFGRKYLKNRI